MTARAYLTAAAIMPALVAVGCNDHTTAERVNPLFRYELYAITTTQGPATKTMFDAETGAKVFVAVPPVFTHADIAALEVTKCDHDPSCVVVVPTPTGLARLEAAVARGKVGVVLNGGLQRQVQLQPDDSGRFTLSGHPAGRVADSALPRIVDRRW